MYKKITNEPPIQRHNKSCVGMDIHFFNFLERSLKQFYKILWKYNFKSMTKLGSEIQNTQFLIKNLNKPFF